MLTMLSNRMEIWNAMELNFPINRSSRLIPFQRVSHHSNWLIFHHNSILHCSPGAFFLRCASNFTVYICPLHEGLPRIPPPLSIINIMQGAVVYNIRHRPLIGVQTTTVLPLPVELIEVILLPYFAIKHIKRWTTHSTTCAKRFAHINTFWRGWYYVK